MTELPELDARGAQAAAGLRRQVESFDAPALPARRPRRLVPAIALAAVLAVVVGIAVVLVGGDHDQPERVDVVEPSAPLRLVPTDLPEGMELRSVEADAVEEPPDQDVRSFVPVDGSFDGPVVTVSASAGALAFGDEPEPGGEPIEVNGVNGMYRRAGVIDSVFFDAQDGRTHAAVTGIGVDRATLIRVAEGVRLEGGRVREVVNLPASLRPAELPDPRGLRTTLGYGDPEPDGGPYLSIDLSPGTPDLLRVLAGFAPSVDAVDIRGQRAFVIDGSVNWLEDGFVVTVSGNISRDQLLATARSLRQVSEAEWDRYAGQVPGDPVIGEGADWKVTLDRAEGGILCAEVPDGDVCVGAISPGRATVVGSVPTIVFGGVSQTVARVVVVPEGGGPVAADTVPVEAVPGNFFAVEVPNGTRSAEVITYDPGGREVERLTAEPA